MHQTAPHFDKEAIGNSEMARRDNDQVHVLEIRDQKGGIGNYSPGVRDHNPRDCDQQTF